jgi:hypothetical protein
VTKGAYSGGRHNALDRHCDWNRTVCRVLL